MDSYMSCPSSNFLRDAYSKQQDVVSFTFETQVQYSENIPLYVDAENPSWSLNLKQVRQLVQTLIAGFQAIGIEKGDTVVIQLPNTVLYSSIFFATIGAGAVYVGINPRSLGDEINRTLQITSAKWIIASPESLSNVLSASANLDVSIIFLDDYAASCVQGFLKPTDGYNPTRWQPDESLSTVRPEPMSSSPGSNKDFLNKTENDITTAPKIIDFSSLLRYPPRPWALVPTTTQNSSLPAALYLTSGTSGLPKAAILTHWNLIAQHLAIYYTVPYSVSRLISLPMFHLFGALWTHIFPIRYGQPVYILPRFEVRKFLHCVFLYRITETYLVPTMLRAISDHCHQQENHRSMSGFLTSLRYVGVAGAPIDKGSMERFRVLMHPEKGLVAQIWGMTEVGVVFQERYCWSHRTGPARSCTCSCSPKALVSDMGSIGGILEPFYEAKLLEIDPEPDSSEERRKTIIEDGIPGELYVRGRLGSLFYGYLGGDYPTRETLEHQQGWFRTGDIVSVRDGRYYVQGRMKELIKVRGWQVAPAEIEATLIKHPAIADAAVIGVLQDDGRDEAPRAFVVRRKMATSDSLITADEVYAFARKQLASYKALDGGVVFVEEIPRTPSGKIQRYKLARVNLL